MSASWHDNLLVVTSGRTCSADPVYASQLEQEVERRGADSATGGLLHMMSEDLPSEVRNLRAVVGGNVLDNFDDTVVRFRVVKFMRTSPSYSICYQAINLRTFEPAAPWLFPLTRGEKAILRDAPRLVPVSEMCWDVPCVRNRMYSIYDERQWYVDAHYDDDDASSFGSLKSETMTIGQMS